MICAAVLLIVYLAAYFYILANKKQLIDQVRNQVANELNGEVLIGDIDLAFLATFPIVSIQLEEVAIRDTVFTVHKHPFLQAKQINASVNFWNVVKKRNPFSGVKVQDGALYIFTDTSGYTNSYLLTPKKKPDSQQKKNSSSNITSVLLKNVRLTLNDQLKGKLYDVTVHKLSTDIHAQKDILTFQNKINLTIHSLALKTAIGSYAKETLFSGKFKLAYDKYKKQLSFDDIKILLKDHPFYFTGKFAFTPASPFYLQIKTTKVPYHLAKSLVTPKIAKGMSLVAIEKPVDKANVFISGSLRGGIPLVKASWVLKNNNLQSKFGDFNHCSMSGTFINELVPGLPRLDPNSRLHFKNFKGRFEKIAISSENIFIDNLKYPTINCDIKSNFTLQQLDEALNSSTVDLRNGTGSVDIQYAGPVAENSLTNTIINGKIKLSNCLVNYLPRNIALSKLNGEIVFKDTDVSIHNFSTEVAGNKIIMNGSGKNLLTFLKNNPGKANINWSISSPKLNLDRFTSLLKKRVVVKRRPGKAKLQRTTQQIDNLVNQANFQLQLTAGQLVYKKFNATNVHASIHLINENWLLNDVSLNHGGGSIQLKGGLSEVNNDVYLTRIRANLNNVDVNKVMYAFNNFGQDGISYQNLKGKLTASANVSMLMDRDVKGTPRQMNGYVNFSIKKGALLQFEPMQKIQKIIFKKRNFDEIHFAELKDRLDIKDKEITINRMEIQSTVLSLFVEGIFSMQGKTDISVQVPLSNLKKRDGDYIPKNKGADAKGGMSIYLRGRTGEDGNVKFKVDLFKKFRKEDDGKADEPPTADETKETSTDTLPSKKRRGLRKLLPF